MDNEQNKADLICSFNMLTQEQIKLMVEVITSLSKSQQKMDALNAIPTKSKLRRFFCQYFTISSCCAKAN